MKDSCKKPYHKRDLQTNYFSNSIDMTHHYKTHFALSFVSTNSLSSRYVNFKFIKFGENLIKLCVVWFNLIFGYLKIRLF